MDGHWGGAGTTDRGVGEVRESRRMVKQLSEEGPLPGEVDRVRVRVDPTRGRGELPDRGLCLRSPLEYTRPPSFTTRNLFLA